MQQSKLARLVGLAFAMAAAVESDGGGVAPEANNGVKSYVMEGKKAGQKISEAMGRADSTAKETLLASAEMLSKISDNLFPDTLSLWLEGYSQAFSEKDANYAKVMKSQAKAVIEAYRIDTPFEMVDGYEKDEQGLPKRDADKNIVYIKRSKLPSDWLNEHKGGYADFCKLATKLRGGATGQGAGGGNQTGSTRAKVMTTKQQKDAVANLDHAMLSQAVEVGAKAVEVVARNKGFEIPLVHSIIMQCNTIKTKSNDLGAIEVASAILDAAETGLQRLMAEKAKREQTEAASKSPTPAKAEQSGSEVLRGDQKTGTHG